MTVIVIGLSVLGILVGLPIIANWVASSLLHKVGVLRIDGDYDLLVLGWRWRKYGKYFRFMKREVK